MSPLVVEEIVFDFESGAFAIESSEMPRCRDSSKELATSLDIPLLLDLSDLSVSDPLEKTDFEAPVLSHESFQRWPIVARESISFD